MNDDDDAPATPVGMLHSLRLLADNASTLQLTLTLAALQQAMETCRTEATRRGRPFSTTLH